MSNFFLTDRVKETSRTVGGGDILLDGAVQGFSAFEDFYSDGDTFYYAITDGSDYEVGSGVFTIAGSNNTIVRFPVQSTNANALVNFNTGVKEVFVTYAGFSSVYSASGIAGRPEPAKSGIPFWSTDQIISYNPNIIWDDSNNRIGVYQENPKFALEVGGTVDYSVVRASGFMDGGSGILFSGVAGSFSGGRQLEPFLRNQVNNETGTDAVIEYSGLVSESILFVKQIPNTVFAGPQSDCGCVSDYPTFRLLQGTDMPATLVDSSGNLKFQIAELDTIGPPVELKDKTSGHRIPRNTGVMVIYENTSAGYSGIAFCGASNIWYTSPSTYLPLDEVIT